jgi:hypothetical protein
VITPHALLAAEGRRTRRQLAAVAALSLLALVLVLAWPRASVPGDDERVQQQLAALRADLARLHERLAALATPLAPRIPPTDARAIDAVRYELANARAGAALAALPGQPKEHR